MNKFRVFKLVMLSVVVSGVLDKALVNGRFGVVDIGFSRI